MKFVGRTFLLRDLFSFVPWSKMMYSEPNMLPLPRSQFSVPFPNHRPDSDAPQFPHKAVVACAAHVALLRGNMVVRRLQRTAPLAECADRTTLGTYPKTRSAFLRSREWV